MVYPEGEEDVTSSTLAICSEGDHVEREACKKPGREEKAILAHASQRAPFQPGRGSTCPGRKGQALRPGVMVDWEEGPFWKVLMKSRSWSQQSQVAHPGM